jgi:hypothetical protein
MYKNILNALLLAFAGLSSLQAQLAVNFTPEVYGQTLDGLSYARVINTQPNILIGKMTIRVRESRNGNVVTALLPPFRINPGTNNIDRAAFSAAKFAFGRNNFGISLSQSGRFPEGEYEYCFEIEFSEFKDPTVSPVLENCRRHYYLSTP